MGEHLRGQRELLLEKKNREREAQLNMCQQTGQAVDQAKLAGQLATERAAGLRPAGACDAGMRLVREPSGQVATGGEEVVAQAVDAEAAAAAMRQTITRQLKQTLTGSLRT